MNIAEIEIQLAKLVEEPFDPSEFALRLLEIYNAPKATVTKLRNGAQNKGEHKQATCSGRVNSISVPPQTGWRT